MDIQELIKQGIDRQNKRRIAEENRRLEAQRKFEAEERTKDVEFQKSVLNQLPEAVQRHVEFTVGIRRHFTICVPECLPVTGSCQRGNTTIYLYTVNVPDFITSEYQEGEKIRYRQESFSEGDLDIALSVAFRAYPVEQSLAAEIVVNNKKREKADAEMAENRERRTREQVKRDAEENEKEKQKKAAFLDWLEADPVAAALVRVFAAIQSERDGWEGQVEAMGDYADRAAERQAERLSQAENATAAAQRRADDATWKAQQVEDRVYDLERKTKRGW